jgi:hypothetical protein
MKVKERKYIALVTLFSMLIASFIPAQSFASEESEPCISVLVEEMGEVDISDLQSATEDEKEQASTEAESAAEENPEEQDKAEPELLTEIELADAQDDEFRELTSIKDVTGTVLSADNIDNAEYITVNKVFGGAFRGAVNTDPDKWYFGNDLTIDEHFIFGEDRMYTEGKANRGFNCLLDNNVSVPFYVTTNDPEVNYQDLTGKEISVTFHTNSAVVVDHFKIISGGDTYKANYAHRSPTAWSLKAGNSAESCDTVLAENLPVNATKAYEENNYEFDNTTPYKYYKFTVTALAGAGRSGHDSPFSNPTATCLLADILIGGPEETHEHDDGIKFNPWSSANSLPTTVGNYYLANDVTISSTWTVPSGTVNLCLNGHAIIRTGAEGTPGSVIQVGSGATLNLYDCGTETRYYTVANPAANGAGLGTVVDKSVYDSASENARGTFTGGYITGGVITGALDNAHLIGGGVNIDGGTFNMYGGTIIGNNVCINGGGVKVKGAGASFTMNNGAILANYNGCYGGAISVGDNNGSRLCTVTINGGTIARNWSGRNGGAIHTDNYGHTYVIAGGSIVNNYTNGYYENGSNGRSGGGFIKSGATLKVSGSAVFKDNYNGGNVQNNIHLVKNNSDVIDLSGHLDSDAYVGVYARGLTASSDIKVAIGAQKDDLGYVHFDIPDEGSLVYCDGTKDWIYKNDEIVEFTEEAHHTHEAGTIWATAYVVPTHNHDDIGFSDWTATDSLPTTAGNYCLINDVTISSTWIVPQGTTNLCLNGHTLRGSGVENVILVNAGATLTVCDCGTTGTITGGRSNSGYRYGAGVYVVNGHFIFKSGTISGNSLAAGSTGGGGVEAEGEDAVIDMYGGTICNNQAGYGGGVYVRGSTFNFYGGTISNNRALSTDGGGIHVFGGSAKLNMYGGTICDNTATAGGGIGVSGRGTVRIFGGSITGNTSTQVGGGITNRRTNQSGDMNANISIAGNPVITGNIGAGSTSNMYLFNNLLLNIAGELTSDASIGVSMSSIGIFTSGLSGKGTKSNFTSDNSNYMVALKNGEACITNKALDVTVSGYEGNYDGNAHSITVSAPDGATVKYGTEEGSYTLDTCPSYTNAGTYTVHYEVSKEGYTSVSGSATVKINPIDVVITTAPNAKGVLVSDDSEQELISAGAVTGGTFYYAIGDDEVSPDDAEYKAEIPKASDAGYYYIWYKVKGDVNHNDIAPAYIKTTLAEEDWVTVSGVVCDSAKIPVGNATVKLVQGNKIVDKTKSGSDGGYYFAVPAGLYNIVIKTDDATITNMVDVSENITKDVDVSNSSTESLLDVVNSDKSIVVGGLNEEAYAIRTGGNISADKSVAVKLTVKSISEDGTEGAKKIAEDEADKNLEFFDIKLEKNVDSTVTELTETQNVLEFAIPCPYVNKRGLVAYHYHGSEVLTLTEISSKAEKADGTFYVDKENKMMYVYLSRFSTIAMGYTPYYSVKSNISLGNFTGNVSVTLAKVGSSEKYELNDVSLDDISFQDIPKGEYTMTIKWEDGAVNTLPPISISVK